MKKGKSMDELTMKIMVEVTNQVLDFTGFQESIAKELRTQYQC